MKKFTAILVILAAVTAFTGCGNDENKTGADNNLNSSAVQQDGSQADDTDNNSSADVQEENTDNNTGNGAVFDPVSGSLSSEDAAQKLLVFVNDGDRIAACAIDKVPDSAVTKNGAQYLKTDSSTFKSVADIESYFSTYFTEEKTAAMSLTSGDFQTYTDIDGELYVLDAGRGCGYNWVRKNGRIETIIADETDDSFTVFAPFDKFGTEERAEISVVKENGCWKIAGYGMGESSDEFADESDAFTGKWSSERVSMDISRNSDSSYSVQITGSSGAFVTTSWNYTCYYNPASGTLDSVTGSKETVVYAEGGSVESSNMEGGQSASFYSDSSGIQWVDNASVGNGRRFVRAEAD